jgi:hypothetical protein
VVAKQQIGKCIVKSYQEYLDKRPENQSKAAGFYIEVANILAAKGSFSAAQKVLSNITEISIEDPQPLRIYGYKLEEISQKFPSKVLISKIVQIFSKVLCVNKILFSCVD